MLLQEVSQIVEAVRLKTEEHGKADRAGGPELSSTRSSLVRICPVAN